MVALESHDHAETTAAYGDVHAGFTPAALRRMMTRAGFDVDACDVTRRDARPPGFRVLTALATQPPRGMA